MVGTRFAWIRQIRCWPRSFRYRIFLGMILSIGIIMLMSVIQSGMRQRRDLLQQNEDSLRALAQTLAVHGETELLEYDVQGMQELLGSVSHAPELKYAMILSPAGRVLAHTETQRVGSYLMDEASRSWLAGPIRPSTLVRTADLIDVAAPVFSQGRPVGWVRMAFGQEAVRASLRTIFRDGMLFTALAMSLGALAAHLLSRRLTGGLETLLSLTRVAAGRDSGPSDAPSTRMDELGELGQAFDRLTYELDWRVKALKSHERFLVDLLENLPVIVLVHGPDGAVQLGNSASLELFGKSAEGILGLSFSDLAGPIYREDGRLVPLDEHPMTRAMKNREAIQASVIGLRSSPEAEMKWFLLNVFPEIDAEGSLHRILLAMTDISDRQRAKIDLRKTLAEVEDLYQNAPCGYQSLDQDGRFLRINNTELKWLGYAREEVLGKLTFFDLLTPAGQSVFAEKFEQFKRLGWAHDMEFELIRKDGTLLSVLVNASAIQAPDGSFLYSRSTLTDITDRSKAERSLRASQSSLAEAQRMAHMGNWELDLVKNVLTWSDEIYRIFEIDPAAFGSSYEAFLKLIHPEDREQVAKAFAESVQSRKPYDIVHRLKLPDGRIKFVHERCETHYGSTGQPLRSCGTVQDVTEKEIAEQERRRLEAEVHHFHRLDSLGNLAGGVAHDMNNILAVILNLVELQMERRPEPGPMTHDFEVIKKVCMNGADLVKRLTQFARKQMDVSACLDLNALVRDQVDTLERTTLKRADWMLELEDPLPPVLGQASEISNAIINIAINALDAMPRGGRIVFRTKGLANGGVRLSIQDNGTGMPPDVLARAMDPFYTTKAVGKGTGLGLSTVYGTMKSHGGTVDIQSECGVGTTINLTFPPAKGEEMKAVGNAARPADLKGLRVLLVDDNDLIRLTVPELLEGMGLIVESTGSGLLALERLKVGPPVGLVILDQNMPALTGAETLQRIHALYPELPVLLSSGYQDEDGLLAVGDRRVGILGKPYTLEALRLAIASLLAPAPSVPDLV